MGASSPASSPGGIQPMTLCPFDVVRRSAARRWTCTPGSAKAPWTWGFSSSRPFCTSSIGIGAASKSIASTSPLTANTGMPDPARA